MKSSASQCKVGIADPLSLQGDSSLTVLGGGHTHLPKHGDDYYGDPYGKNVRSPDGAGVGDWPT